MDKAYKKAAMDVLKDYLEDAGMEAQIIEDEDTGNRLIQSIFLDEKEVLEIHYEIDFHSQFIEDTVILKLTGRSTVTVPENKTQDVLLYFNLLNMHNPIGHYYLFGEIPVITYSYAVPGETLGAAENLIEMMFLFSYGFVAGMDGLKKIIQEDLPTEVAYAHYAEDYLYYVSDGDPLEGYDEDENQ